MARAEAEGTHARRGGGGSRVTKSRRREGASPRRGLGLRRARRSPRRRARSLACRTRRRSRGEGGTRSVVARFSPQSYRFAVGIRARRRRGGGPLVGVAPSRPPGRDAVDAAEETARRATRRAELADRALDERRAASSRRAVEAAVVFGDALRTRRSSRGDGGVGRSALLREKNRPRWNGTPRKTPRARTPRGKPSRTPSPPSRRTSRVLARGSSGLAGLDDGSPSRPRVQSAVARAGACGRLERVVRGARACVVAKKPSRARAVNRRKRSSWRRGAATQWWSGSAREGWSSAVAPARGECLRGGTRRFRETPRGAREAFESRPGHAGRGPRPERPDPRLRDPRLRGHSEAFGAAVLAADDVRSRREAERPFAVAARTASRVAVDLADRGGAPADDSRTRRRARNRARRTRGVRRRGRRRETNGTTRRASDAR